MVRRRSTDGLLVALAALFTLLTPLGGADTPAFAKRGPLPPLRFEFKIDPKTPVKDLMPPAPEVKEATLPWLVRNLADVPEVLFAKQEVVKHKLQANNKEFSKEAAEKAILEADTQQDQAMEKTARLIAQINLINKQDPEYLIRVLRKTRPDLEGLPFIMGDACRQSKSRGTAFLHGVSFVANAADDSNKPLDDEQVQADRFWAAYHTALNPPKEQGPRQEGDAQENNRERVAALMQMLGPKSPVMRRKLVKHIVDLEHADMSPTLARLAVFSFDRDIRAMAVAALGKRAKEEYTAILVAGLRHPWPAVAQEAAQAIVELKRKDLVPHLVALLDEPDSRAPIEREVAGEKQIVVRELVRLNHHRNCLLCHPPGNTPDVKISKFGRVMDIAAGGVPSPGQPFPRSPSGYDPSASPDILVRADVTYLRQDFSRLEKVSNAAPWPEMQRFDYLVRTRKVSSAEALAYKLWRVQQGPDYVPPHHQAIHVALRELTGRDVTTPTAKAWRAALAQ